MPSYNLRTKPQYANSNYPSRQKDTTLPSLYSPCRGLIMRIFLNRISFSFSCVQNVSIQCSIRIRSTLCVFDISPRTVLQQRHGVVLEFLAFAPIRRTMLIWISLVYALPHLNFSSKLFWKAEPSISLRKMCWTLLGPTRLWEYEAY